MEKWQIEADRLIADFQTTNTGFSTGERTKFLHYLAHGFGLEAPGEYDVGYEEGYSAGQDDCGECEECEDKS